MDASRFIERILNTLLVALISTMVICTTLLFIINNNLQSTYSVSFSMPQFPHRNFLLPKISFDYAENAPKIVQRRTSKIVKIKSPSVHRDNSEYLAYSSFREIEGINLKLEQERALKSSLVAYRDNLVSWGDYIARPIFGNNESLMSYLGSLIDQPNLQDDIKLASAAIEKPETPSDEIVEYNLASDASNDEQVSSNKNPFISRPAVSTRMDDILGRYINQGPPVQNVKRITKAKDRQQTYWISITAKSLSDSLALSDFEISAAYGKDEIMSSDESKIKFQNLCKENCGSFIGEIKSRDMKEMTIYIPLEQKRDIEETFYLMSEDEFERLYTDHALTPDSSVVIVQLDQSIKGIDLDRPFQKKLYMSHQWAPVETMSNAAYVLLLGVESGPVTIKIFTDRGYAQDMLAMTPKGLHFFVPKLVSKSEVIASFFMQDTLASKSRPLDLQASDLKPFDKGQEISQITYNQFILKNELLIQSSRNYHQLSLQGSGIFFGFSKEKNLEKSFKLPSNEFKRVVTDYLGVSEDDGQCIIQVNNNDRIESIDYRLNNFNGDDENVDMLSLNDDGTFSPEAQVETKNIFFKSDVPGYLNLRINYLDGSHRNLQSFCIKNTYLVEHL